MTIFLTIGIASGLVGLVVFLMGWIGRRVNDHPTCRGCKYDLSGVWPDSARCPECGGDITISKAVLKGFRAKRRGLLLIGFFLLLTGSAGTGVAVWPVVKSITSWHELKPDWWLVLETESSNPITVDRAASMLGVRIVKGTISDGNIETLLARGLAAQADFERPWNHGWGNLIEHAWYADRMTVAQKSQYLQHLAVHTLDVRDVIQPGEDLGITLEVKYVRGADQPVYPPGNMAPRGLGWRMTTLSAVRGSTIDEIPVRVEMPIPLFGMMYGAFIETYGWTIQRPKGELGEHTVTLDLEVNGDLHLSSFGHIRDQSGDPAYPSFRKSISATFRIIEEDESAKHIVPNPALRSAIAESITLDSHEFKYNRDGVLEFSGRVIIKDPPVAVAFDAFLRDEQGREWALGEMVNRRPYARYTCRPNFRARVPGFKGGPVEIVFRSSWKAAARDAKFEKIWGGEIVLSDIELSPVPENPEEAAESESGGG